MFKNPISNHPKAPSIQRFAELTAFKADEKAKTIKVDFKITHKVDGVEIPAMDAAIDYICLGEMYFVLDGTYRPWVEADGAANKIADYELFMSLVTSDLSISNIIKVALTVIDNDLNINSINHKLKLV